MKQCKKKNSLSALQLALIITGAILAAAGIILLILKLCKKCPVHSKSKKHIDDSDIFDGNDESWDVDEDLFDNIDLDDDEMGSDCGGCGCPACDDCADSIAGDAPETPAN